MPSAARPSGFDDKALAVRGAVEQKIEESGNERIIPAADVLNVVNERIKLRRRFRREPLRAGTVQAFDGETGERVHAVGERLARRLVAADAVFGRKQQPEIADVFQHADAAAVIAASSRRRGNERDPPRKTRRERGAVNAEPEHKNTSLQSKKLEVNFLQKKRIPREDSLWNIR